MHPADLKQALLDLGLDKPGLAGLLGVTLRAVNMWSAGDREVPGPAAAYIRLLQSLPAALQAKEIAQLRRGDQIMYDGMYAVEYEGKAGRGAAVLVFMDGVVFGHDGGVRYDGTYAPSPGEPGKMEMRLWLTVPPGVALVQGVAPQPAEYRFEIHVSVRPRGNAALNVQTPYGPVVSQLRFLRPLPDQLAA